MAFIHFALKWLVILFIAACFVVPGAAMLLFPSRAFRTAAKPRWLGLPVLLFGLWLVYYVDWLRVATLF